MVARNTKNTLLPVSLFFSFFPFFFFSTSLLASRDKLGSVSCARPGESPNYVVAERVVWPIRGQSTSGTVTRPPRVPSFRQVMVQAYVSHSHVMIPSLCFQVADELAMDDKCDREKSHTKKGKMETLITARKYPA